jgi:hypoxanthine phosphoribosyltransferase
MNIKFNEKVLEKRISELAEEISKDYKGQELVVICLLNGASIFYADLVRKLTIPVTVQFIGFTSYPIANKTGEVRITLDVTEPLENKNILIVEGIMVSGRTPKFIYDTLSLRAPKSISFCAIGIKKHLFKVDMPVKYQAFEIGDEMLVGYGIGKGPERVLPYIIEERN